jgi:hypothetical protein
MLILTFSSAPGTTVPTGTNTVFIEDRKACYTTDGATAAIVAAHPAAAFTSANGRHFRLFPTNGTIHGEQLGMIGDGTTDDRLAFKATIAYAVEIGAKVVLSPKTYALGTIPAAEYNYNIGPQPSIVLPHNCPEIDFQGATIRLFQAGRGIIASNALYPNTTVTSAVAADVAAGSYAITLATGEGVNWSAGDVGFWQLGEIPYDKPETTNWGAFTVLSVAGDVVTLDRPVPDPFTLASVTTGKKRLVKVESLTPLTIGNVYIDGTLSATLGAESGLNVGYRTNVTLNNVGGRFCGAGVIVAQYIEGMTINGSYADGVNTTQASYGRHFSFAECRGVQVNGGRARAMKGGIFAEADAEIRVDGYQFDNTWPGDGTAPAANTVVVLAALGRATISARNLLVTGMGGCNVALVSNGQAGWEGSIELDGETRIRTSADPFALPVTKMAGILEYSVAGVRQRYNLDRARRWVRRFRLKESMSGVASFGPPGMVVAARVYVSPGASVGAGNDLTALYFGKTSNNGSNFAGTGVSGIVAASGSMVELPIYAGAVNGTLWTYRNENQKIILSTATAPGLDAKDEFVLVEVDYVVEEGAKSYAYAEAYLRAEGDDYEFCEALVRGVDLASIAAGATGTVTLTIPDMTSNDIFVGFGIAGGYGGLELAGFEPQAGQGVATFYNRTGSAIDLTARDIRVVFAKGQVGM